MENKNTYKHGAAWFLSKFAESGIGIAASALITIVASGALLIKGDGIDMFDAVVLMDVAKATTIVVGATSVAFAVAAAGEGKKYVASYFGKKALRALVATAALTTVALGGTSFALYSALKAKQSDWSKANLSEIYNNNSLPTSKEKTASPSFQPQPAFKR